jgi:hypothetical protein
MKKKERSLGFSERQYFVTVRKGKFEVSEGFRQLALFFHVRVDSKQNNALGSEGKVMGIGQYCVLSRENELRIWDSF